MAGAAAKRYARAIFELAQETGEQDAWETRLQVLRQICAMEEVRRVLQDPSVPTARRMEAAEALRMPELGEPGMNLLRLLVEARRIGSVDAIADEFEVMADEAAGRVRALVTTAIELEDGDRRHLGQQLTQRLGREVRLEARVDPTVLGGLVLRYGDHVIDGSVRTRLEQLRRRLGGD
jgi:F-type H+-transporting ATPase subunit delta